MCGIYGILDTSMGGLVSSDLGMVSQMGTLTELRGRHSSGLFTVGKEGENGPIVKALGPSINLIHEKNWGKFESAFPKARVVIGHGRWATVGNITKQNAHPFREGHVTLVHNGTIRSGLEEVHKDKIEVDSHALAVSIAKEGLEATIRKLQGAWAVIAYDSKKKALQILRNSERELHYAKTNFSYLIMSERGALEYLLERNKLNADVHSFKPDTLYTFDLEERTLKEGDVVTGKKHWEVVYTPSTNHTWKNSEPVIKNGGTDSTRRVYHVPQQTGTVTLSTEYEVGDNIEFTLRDMTIINAHAHCKGFDKKGNEVRFTTGNQAAFPSLVNGRTGVGRVIGVGLDYAKKKVDYTIKYRDIVWDTDTAPETSEEVELMGGGTIEKKKWRSLCNSQQCWGCQGAVDPDDHKETIVLERTLAGSPYTQIFCKHCVDEHVRIGGASSPHNFMKYLTQ